MQLLKRARQAGWVVLLTALVGAWIVSAQNSGDPLARGFQNPPESAKPRVWWHWMNGNITKEGIKLDLEWMKRVGIGGFQNFDAALNTPQVVEKRLVYMTPEWKDAFKYTVTLADQLGLEMAIAGSPGWSESGGPWVPPAQAMKKFVWTETRVQGGQPFTGTLPKPPSTTGPYQDFPIGPGTLGEPPTTATYYADAAVVAFRAPESDRPMVELQPKVTSSGGSFNLTSLTDGNVAHFTLLPAAPVGEKAWLQFEFAQPQSIQGFTLITPTSLGRYLARLSGGITGQALEASDDGREFHLVAEVPTGARTVAFPAVTARFFRLAVTTQPPTPSQPGAPAPTVARGTIPASPAGTQIAEFVLHTAPRVNRVEDKAAFRSAPVIASMDTPPSPASESVRKSEVLDLTSKMRPDGSLDWAPPAGNWIVLRLGYSLLGIANHPASPEATGLEVDKLSRTAVKAYFENYLDQYKDATGGLMGICGAQYRP